VRTSSSSHRTVLSPLKDILNFFTQSDSGGITGKDGEKRNTRHYQYSYCPYSFCPRSAPTCCYDAMCSITLEGSNTLFASEQDIIRGVQNSRHCGRRHRDTWARYGNVNRYSGNIDLQVILICG